MKVTNRIMSALSAVLLATGVQLQGASLELSDGSRLEGELLEINEGTVRIATAFAGELSIPLEQVVNLSTEEAVQLRTGSGEVLVGPVRGSNGQLAVESASGEAQASLGEVEAAWQVGERDPAVAAREAELADQLRSWRFRIGADVSGSDGNTEEFGSSLQFSASLEGPSDRLNFYGSYNYAETNGVRSSDEQKGGVRYTNYFTERWGWFVRQELERDTFEGIDFRSTTAAGISHKIIERDRLQLEGTAGLSYRYEDYVDDTSEADGFPGLDFGLELDWQFADWGKWVSSLSYLPSVDDFGDYLIEHESGVDIPLGASDFWVMRFGLSHQYNSEPDGGRDELDTTYFARLILTWD